MNFIFKKSLLSKKDWPKKKTFKLAPLTGCKCLVDLILAPPDEAKGPLQRAFFLLKYFAAKIFFCKVNAKNC